MPAGVEVAVDGDGFATIAFIDPVLRGPALGRLLAIGGPDTIETLTWGDSRVRYRVPEGNAREAGLIDDGPATGETIEDAATPSSGDAIGGPPRQRQRQRRRKR